MVLQAIQTVLSIFVMIAIGMLLYRIGWLNDSNSSLISRLVVRVALPCMIINSMLGSFTQDSLGECLRGLIVPFASLFLTLAVACLAARVLKLPKGRRGVFVAMFTFSNSVFIGVPVSTALFGEGVMPYTLMYYIANTVTFWTIGVRFIIKDGDAAEGEKGSLRAVPGYIAARMRGDRSENQPATLALAKIGKVVQIPLVVFAVCFLLVLAGVKLPYFVMSSAKYVGSLVTPLALFYTGTVFMRMIKTKRLKWEKGFLLMLIGRFVISPLLLALGARFMQLPDLMRDVLIVQASMPVMSQTPIISGMYDADAEYAAGGVVISTLLSLISIPVYMAIL